MEPMDRTDPFDPMHKSESSDQSDHLDEGLRTGLTFPSLPG